MKDAGAHIPGQEPIAIVGMGCVYPQAADLRAYWKNILGKVDAVSEAPEDWNGSDYLDPDSGENDRIYTNRGGFLRDLARFDPLRHGVMPNSVDGGEPDQFLALEIAADAVEDADFSARPVPGDRVAVILGRGTYINRGFASVVQHGVMVDRMIDILRKLHPDTSDAEAAELKTELKASLPPFNTEMAAALVPNLVTGRISNRLDFRGANYIIDAACASSLIALERGLADLRAGACDMALVGGVHASTPAPIYQIFCQLGALSRKGNIRPFSAEADGTLLAEGVGILCLKRLSDAEAAGDRIYALVRSVGVASDGKGMSILAPRLEGERLAIKRAYEAADIDPASVSLIEAHGTATNVGDATEIEALTEEFGGTDGPCALGSVKSMIGHCLPASGSAGLIKAAMALHHRVLPPTLIDSANPDLGLEGSNFYLNTEARPWINGRDTPRRAGVNAFGFGGINAHAVLEEYTGASDPTPVITRDSALIVFDAPDAASAPAAIDAMEARLRAETSLDALAREAAQTLGAGRCRMAIVANTTQDALDRLQALRNGLAKGRTRLRQRAGAYYSTEPLAEEGKVAFLFPGEGSQYRNMLQPLMLHYPQMRRWFDVVDGAYANDPSRMRVSDVFFPPPLSEGSDDNIWRMDVGPEAIFAANMAVATLFDHIGLKADMYVGHSTGEYAALSAAGVTARDDPAALQREIRELNAVFEAAEAAGDIAEGTLFTLGPVKTETLRARLEERGDVHLGMDNCSAQQVVAATTHAGAAWVAALGKELGGFCDALPFKRAYHCAAFRPFSKRLEIFLKSIAVNAPTQPVYSCLTAAPFPGAEGEIRQLMADQWSGEVRFQDTIRQMHADGARIFVECGPRNNLTAFVGDILRKEPYLAVAADTAGRTGLEQLHHMAASLVVEGVPLDLDALCGPEDAAKPSAAQPLKMGLQPMQISDKPRPRKAPGPDAQPDIAPEQPPAAQPKAPSPMETLVDGYFSTMQKMVETEKQVMAAYLGAPTPTPDTQPARFPMLSSVQTSADGQKLEARLLISHARAPYLSDHSFGRATSINAPGRHGLSVVPLTFTMEALAEVAAALRPGLQVTGLREVRGSRWISVEKPAEVTLEATAEIVEDTAQRTVIRTRIRDADGPVFRPVIAEADIELAPQRAPAPAAQSFAPKAAKPAQWSLEDVYSRIMFHGPRLQAVASMDMVAPAACEGGLIGRAHDALFSHQSAPQFETDAITLDAVGQLVGVWSADQLDEAFHIFPFRVEHVELFRDPLATGETARCRCDIALVGADEMRSDIDVVTEDGRLQCRIKGWWDKRFDLPQTFFAARLDPARNSLSRLFEPRSALPDLHLALTDGLTDDLLAGSGGIWAGVLGGLILSDAEAAAWRAVDGEAARFDWVRQHAALKDAVRAWRGTELYPADITLGVQDNRPALVSGWPQDWGDVPVMAGAGQADMAIAAAGDPKRYTALGVAFETGAPRDQALAGLSAAELALLPAGPAPQAQYANWMRLAKDAAGRADPDGQYEISGLAPERREVTLTHPARRQQVIAHLIEDTRQALTIAVVALARPNEDKRTSS